MKTTSTREEATRIIAEWVASLDEAVARPAGSVSRLTNAIDKALQARDERAAKIAEQDSIISWTGGSTGDAKGNGKAYRRCHQE